MRGLKVKSRKTESASKDHWPVFISYRRSAATAEVALWLKKSLESETIEAATGKSFHLDVFVDVDEPHHRDFQENLIPHLRHSRALIVLADEGVASRKSGIEDYLYDELNWWATSRRKTPPVIVQLDAVSGGKLVANPSFHSWRRVGFIDCFWTQWNENTAYGQVERERLLRRVRESIRDYGRVIHLDEVRRLKRWALWAWVLAGGAILGGVIAFLALVEQKRLNAVALSQRNLALRSIETLIHEVQDQLQYRPGMRKTRIGLLHIALTQLSEIARDFGNDKELGKRDQTTIRARLADIKMELGDYAASLPDAKLVLDDRKAELARYAGDLDRLRELVAAYQRLAEVTSGLGFKQDAFELLKTSEPAARSLRRAKPAEIGSAKDLAQTLGRLGSVLLDLGRPGEAKPYLQENHELCELIFYNSPADVDALVRAADANFLLGRLHQTLHENVPGQDYLDAFSDAKTFIERHGELDYPYLIQSNAARAAALAFAADSDFSQASEYLAASIQLSERVYNKDDQNAEALSCLIQALSEQGKALAKQKRAEEARIAVAQAIVRLNDFTLRFREGYQAPGLEESVHEAAGLTLFELKQFNDAARESQLAFEILMRESVVTNSTVYHRENLVRVTLCLSNSIAILNDLPRAIDILNRGLGERHVAKWILSDEEPIVELIAALSLQADLLLATHNNAGARTAVDTALHVLDKLQVRREPTSGERTLRTRIEKLSAMVAGASTIRPDTVSSP